MPIICVGNLRVGGEGKSPHIEYLIGLLKNEFNMATLSRGYKRKTKDFQLAAPDSTVYDIGDEPLQFSKKFPDITVAVDKDRVLGIAHILTQREETQVILLDDAFQHRYVKAGLTILLTSYQHLYINDQLLPAGNLRESKNGAKRADIIIVSKCPADLSDESKKQIEQQLKLTSRQQLYFTEIVYSKLTPINETPQLLPSPQAACLLVTGIANPESLLAECRKNYREVVHIGFGDHHAFSKYDMEIVHKKFDAITGSEKFILTTEKDAMRIGSEALRPFIKNLPLYFLPITIRFIGRETQFNEQIKNYVRSNQTNR